MTPCLKVGACKKANLEADQPESFKDYVRGEYIGTSGCVASPDLCGGRLNRRNGVKSVPSTYKTVP